MVRYKTAVERRKLVTWSLARLGVKYNALVTQLSSERRKAGKSRLGRNQTAFRILISTILSHRTKDARTQEATDALLLQYPTAQALSAAPIPQIARLIKPVGFYHSKANYVKKCSQELVREFGGLVPDDRESLMSLTGVGPKTSACVLNYAFDKEVVAVDTHVHRVSNRIGLVRTKTPEETEAELTKITPKAQQLVVNELLVLHGQNTCKPAVPTCSACPLSTKCAYYASGKRRN